MDKPTINTVTNGIGAIVGLPEIITGVPLLIAGDFINGGLMVIKGLALFIGFYLVGK